MPTEKQCRDCILESSDIECLFIAIDRTTRAAKNISISIWVRGSSRGTYEAVVQETVLKRAARRAEVALITFAHGLVVSKV